MIKIEKKYYKIALRSINIIIIIKIMTFVDCAYYYNIILYLETRKKRKNIFLNKSFRIR